MNFQTVESAKEDVAKFMTSLNAHLLTRTYLVGECVTLADISVAMTLLHLYQYVLEPTLRAPYKNVNRWFQTVINQPEAIAVIGNFKLADKTLEYDLKKVVDHHQGKGSKKEKDSKKESKKEAKKAAPAAAAEELDAADAALAAEPKSSNPFDAMPKGTFDMDDFKRYYSNQDVDKSIPYFWEKFDPENYSIWLGEYKYNDELTKVIICCVNHTRYVIPSPLLLLL